MEEIGIKIWLKKINFHNIKNEQETLYFGENGVVKYDFHKNKRRVNINEVDICIDICNRYA